MVDSGLKPPESDGRVLSVPFIGRRLDEPEAGEKGKDFVEVEAFKPVVSLHVIEGLGDRAR